MNLSKPSLSTDRNVRAFFLTKEGCRDTQCVDYTLRVKTVKQDVANVSVYFSFSKY